MIDNKLITKTTISFITLVLLVSAGFTISLTSTNKNSVDIINAPTNSPEIANISGLNKEDYSIPFSGFVKNNGQLKNSEIEYYYSGSGFSIRFLNSMVEFVIQDPSSIIENELISITFPDANIITPQGVNQNSHNNNYFRGDSTFTDVPTYSEIIFKNIYSGIDLRYYMSEEGVKYDFIINPFANPDEIKIKVSDSTKLFVSPDTVDFLSLEIPGLIQLQDRGLKVFQDEGKSLIPSQFTDFKDNVYGFNILSYDPSKPMVIDPLILTFSTLIGGSGDDESNSITVDSDGYIYITGYTVDTTIDFPTTINSLNTTHNSGSSNGYDVFVVKLNPDGSSLNYSTFLGGSGDDIGNDIEVDASGNAYITGKTLDYTIDFPTTSGAYDTLAEHSGLGGQDNVFVTKLNATGNGLVYSTFVGGYNADEGYAITLDDSNNAYITGSAGNSFPTTSGVFNQTHGGGSDVFVAKLSTDGSTLIFSTLLGSDGREHGRGIELDASGNMYVSGQTEHTNGIDTSYYPTTAGAYNQTHGGYWEVFVTKLNPTASSLLYSTFIGGSASDQAYAMALDTNNNVYVSGDTWSSNYPTTSGAYTTTINGNNDLFITKLNAAGSGLVYSTFLGTGSNDWGLGLSVDSNFNAYVTGYGNAYTWPTTPDAYEEAGAAASKIILTQLNSAGDTLVYSTVLGSTSSESGKSVYVDTKFNVYVTGYTSSSNFPKTSGAYDLTYNGGKDVFVTKFTYPISIDSPSDLSFDEGTTGNTIIWIPSGSDPDRYEILQNGSQTQSGGWSDGNQISINIDDLGYGSHNYQIILYDVSGTSVTDTVVITVTDTTLPILNFPSDASYDEGTTGNSITWIATDLNPDTYEITRNGLPVANGVWSSGVGIVLDIDGLSRGSHTFIITVVDKDGNSDTDQVVVAVADGTPPVLDNPNDISYELGSTGNSISWIATDNYANTYVLYRNGTQVASGSWTTGVDIITNIDNLSTGTYNYTLQVFDQSGNSVSDLVFVVVFDSTIPGISSPDDIVYEQGQTGNSIVWTATDLEAGNYKIYQNSNLVTSGSWISSTPIVFNIDEWSAGNYNLTIEVKDLDGNSAIDQLLVTVVDTTSPTVFSYPSDVNYAEGVTKNSIYWTVFDFNQWIYEIYQNSTLIVSDYWILDSVISHSLDGLIKGVYNFTIIIVDLYGNTITDQVIVVISDATPPSLTSPQDINISYGITGSTIVWTVSDNYPNSYIIYRNGTQLESGIWISSNPISINIDILSVGTYNFTLLITDSSGNFATDEVIVVIDSDIVAPVLISTPINLQYAEGSIGNDVSWTATDINAGYYFVYIDDVEVEYLLWGSAIPIIVNIDGLSIGDHNVTILISDQFDHSVTDQITVTVVDQTPPSLTSPEDIEYEEGEIGNTISWYANDLHPADYSVYLNGTLIGSDSWVSDTPIVISVVGLSPGIYNFTVSIIDESGQTSTDQVIVVINADITPPGISSPLDIVYEQDNIGNQIIWSVSDTNPANYIVYQNSTMTATDVWLSGTNVQINIDGLDIGIYNFTIVVFDGLGNSAIDEVYVTISEESISPTITSPIDVNYEFGTTGNTISWTGIDNHPDRYIIYQDNIEILSDIWVSGVEISISIDALATGTYAFMIVLSDIAGNTVSDEVIVIVTEKNIPPTIDNPLDISYEEGSTGNTISWTAIDNDPKSFEIFVNDVSLETGTWGSGSPITVSIDGLAVGTYIYRIVVTDSADNDISDSVIVTVTAVSSTSTTTSTSTSTKTSTSTSTSTKTSTSTSTSTQTSETKNKSEDKGFLPYPTFAMIVTLFSLIMIRSLIRKYK